MHSPYLFPSVIEKKTFTLIGNLTNGIKRIVIMAKSLNNTLLLGKMKEVNELQAANTNGK